MNYVEMTANLFLIAGSLFIVSFIGYMHSFVGSTMHNRPLIMGTLTGLLLGDVRSGMMIGSILELIFMTAVPLGADNPPDMTSGTVIGTAVLILTGTGNGVAVVIAIMIAYLVGLYDHFQMNTLLVKAAHKCDQAAEEGDYRKIERIVRSSSITSKLVLSLLTAVLFLIGFPIIRLIVDKIPAFLVRSLDIASMIFPVYGVVMMTKMNISKKNWKYLGVGILLGCLMKVYIVALSGVIVICITLYNDFRKNRYDQLIAAVDKDRSLNKEVSASLFTRSMTLDSGWNYERQQNMNFCYMMIPVLKKLYENNKEEMVSALKRHLEFMACTPHLVTYLGGIMATMEDDNYKNPDYDAKAISSLKSSLMGPISAIGDSLFWSSFLSVAIAVGTSLGFSASVWGAIAFFLIINIPGFLSRYFGLVAGYRYGTDLLSSLTSSGLIEKITYYASVLSLLVISSLIPSLIRFETVSVFIPVITSLVAFVIIYFLSERNVKSIYILLIIVMVSVLLACVI